MYPLRTLVNFDESSVYVYDQRHLSANFSLSTAPVPETNAHVCTHMYIQIYSCINIYSVTMYIQMNFMCVYIYTYICLSHSLSLSLSLCLSLSLSLFFLSLQSRHTSLVQSHFGTWRRPTGNQIKHNKSFNAFQRALLARSNGSVASESLDGAVKAMLLCSGREGVSMPGFVLL